MCTPRRASRSTSRRTTSCGSRAATSTGRFVEAGELVPGDQLEWHRAESWGIGEITTREIAEAALAGWLQSDGFVGQYTGTNRSLTIEAMTVTDAERDVGHRGRSTTVFPDAHRHERAGRDPGPVARLPPHSGSTATICARSSSGGASCRAASTCRCRRTCSPRRSRSSPRTCAACSRPRATCRSASAAAVVGLDMISEEIVRGAQQLLMRFGIYSRVRFKADRRAEPQGLLVALDPGRRRPPALRRRDRIHRRPRRPTSSRRRSTFPGSRRRAREAARDRAHRVARRDGRLRHPDRERRVPQQQPPGAQLLHPRGRRHDGRDPQLVPRRGHIFKGGSGSGINLSQHPLVATSSLKGGGTASGPVSFMRGADASAGTIKSGGKTRRAAKMVILDVDHPDVEEFIWCKATEERKARALRDAGFDMDLDGKDSHSIQYQNANNSVRVTDDFMQAVIDDHDWALKAVTTGETIRRCRRATSCARSPRPRGSAPTRACSSTPRSTAGTPRPNTGRINASNPCSRVHAPGQLGVQPREHQPAASTSTTTAASTSRRSGTPSR